MVDEGLPGLQGAVGEVHLLPVLADHPVHQPHLWPHDPTLPNIKINISQTISKLAKRSK